MEKIVVNAKAERSLIDNYANDWIKEIEKNAKKGISATDIYVPKSVSYGVRDEIERQLNDSKTRFSWCVVARGTNQYTGKPQSFISESYGDDERHYKIQIY